MLLRDGDQGLEVLMLRRTEAAVFSPGAHVFPGGALDPADAGDDVAAYCNGLDDLVASKALGIAEGGLAYFVAAVRECFEEAGVLLAASDRDDRLCAFDEEDTAARFAVHRRAVHNGSTPLATVCANEHITLAVDRLVPFSHWITPPGPPRRFDTRFFIADAPPFQDATPDDREATETRWARPIDMLDAFARGEIDLILPTQRSLEALADHSNAATAIAAASPATA
jgi:8-oxo-dGTP pyrophosphatase MutT (NUDIX family)